MQNKSNNFKLAVYFKEPGELDYPLSEEMYFDSYRQLAKHLAALGVEMIIVRGDAHRGKAVFSEGWNITTSPFTKVDQFTADLIFDRGPFFIDPDLPLLNHPDIHKLCTDKQITYQTFPEYCPLTITVTSQAELQQALNKISTDPVVIKPIDGFGGNEVAIISREEAESFAPTSTMIIQDFLDMSAGIPGLVEGAHDLRIVMLDGEFVYSYLRTPPEGKLTANVSQGGSFKVLAKSEIPEEMLAIVAAIDSRLSAYKHRLYGIDFAQTTVGPKIIEMNSCSGLLPDSDGETFVEFKKNLALKLKEIMVELSER